MAKLAPPPGTLPRAIEVRGVRHNTLRELDVDIPSIATQAMEIQCPVCGVRFGAPGAETFALRRRSAPPGQ